jgi:hypothetical protein
MNGRSIIFPRARRREAVGEAKPAAQLAKTTTGRDARNGRDLVPAGPPGPSAVDEHQCQKLGARNRVEAARLAQQKGWLTPEGKSPAR